MRLRRRKRQLPGGTGTWAIALGTGVGLAAGLYLWRRSRGLRRHAEEEFDRRLAGMEDQVVDMLRADDDLSERPIEVAALADGIIELSGSVDTEAEADQAVNVAQRIPGVRTVLNRMDVLGEVERLEAARRQPDGPGTPRGEAHWTGIGVGTGRRRQARSTDPDRRDDKVDMVEDAIGYDMDIDDDLDTDRTTTPATRHPQQDLRAPGGERDAGGPGTDLSLETRDERGEAGSR